MNVRSRDWCFTKNNYVDDDISKLEDVSSECKYLIIGKEVASTGTLHLQGYIYFENAKSFSKIQKLLPTGSHIEKTKGTPKQASDYCKKENNYVEYGSLPETQGKRTDLDVVKDMVKEGKTLGEIIDSAKSYQSIRSAELILKYKETKRNWKPYVIWIYGSSGTGKTRTAYEKCPSLYRKTNSSGKWWEGYDAHADVLLDDVKDMSKEYYSMLLELLDRYEVRVETKGGSRQFLAKNIIVTSLWSPKEMYQNFCEAKEILRRIDEIIDLTP